MTIAHSTALRNTSLSAGIKGAFDTNMVVRMWTGSPPGPNAAATGTLLGTMTGATAAFAAPSAGSIVAAAIADDTSADAAGTVGYFRMEKATDTNGATGSADPRLEGTVTATGGGGDMTIDNAAITLGGTLHITSFQYNSPT